MIGCGRSTRSVRTRRVPVTQSQLPSESLAPQHRLTAVTWTGVPNDNLLASLNARSPLIPFLLFLLYLASCGNRCGAAPRFEDPRNDTFNPAGVSHDIAYIDSVRSHSSLFIEIGFYNEVDPPSAFTSQSVVGFIDLDVDQNPLTGALSNKTKFSPAGPSALGVEYWVDIFSNRFHAGMAELIAAHTQSVTELVPVTFGSTSLTVEVPLNLIGDDGAVNYGVIVGNSVTMTDEARDVGQPPAYSLPEPPASIAAFAAFAVATALRSIARTNS
ncbi:MAG: hypothetical protein KDA60_00060 [Planctomycetales bacterium]|nr:hypothetical protein [Planctomycetales bacterium]